MNAILIVFYQYFTILSTINKEIILLLIIIVIIIIMTIMIIIMIIMIIIITIIIRRRRIVAMKIIKIIWASLNAKTMNAFKSFVPAPNEED